MHLRRIVFGALAVSLTAGLLAAPADATTRSTRLATGVVMTDWSFTLGGAPERAFTIKVDLSKGNRLLPASPGNVVGRPRQTVLTIGRQEHAVAGVNADFFYFADPTAVPRGGFSRNGRIVKSALVGHDEALWVNPRGVATIGDPGFSGLVETPDRHSFKIRSVNSLENARNGGLTFADRNLLAGPLKAGCTVVRMAIEQGGYRVTSVGRTDHFTRVDVGTRALASCASATATWIGEHVHVGETITARFGYAAAGVSSLMSGGMRLIDGGMRFEDSDGLLGYGDQRKPETFACVLRDPHQVLLGVVEGNQRSSAGMTYRELTSWLLARGCQAAITLDGSYDSTLVAKRPGASLAVVNHPAHGPQQVVNGLYVVRP